jgi:hypothetical protein
MAMDVSRLTSVVSNAATRALAATDNSPETESCLRLYREDANCVAVAVLRAVASFKLEAGERGSRDGDTQSLSKQQLNEIVDALARLRAASPVSRR